MNIDVMYMSESTEWATPQSFFDELDKEFHFDLDPCADKTNHKCDVYFTKEVNGLEQNWGGEEYSAILRMVERLANGLKKVSEKGIRTTRLLSC